MMSMSEALSAAALQRIWFLCEKSDIILRKLGQHEITDFSPKHSLPYKWFLIFVHKQNPDCLFVNIWWVFFLICSVITASLAMKAWILSLKPRFFLATTRKIHTVPLKIDGVDFPWKSEQLGMHEGSCLCLWSISDGQRLFGKRRSCCKPHGVDPSSLGKQSTLKNKLPVRGVWTATEAMHASLLQLRTSLPSEIKRELAIKAATMHQSTVLKSFYVPKLQHSAAC